MLRLLRPLVDRLIPAAVSLLLAIVGAELVVRWVRPQTVRLITPSGLYVADAPSGYRHNPGWRGRVTNRTEFDTEASINSRGLRGVEAPEGLQETRILAIGDSFTFGIGVEDEGTYIALLPARLAARGVDAVGLNGGLAGMVSAEEEVAWLGRWGTALAPDLVVLGVFLGNDLQEATSLGDFDVIDGALMPRGERPGVKKWLYHHSHLYVLLKTGLPPGLQRRIRRILRMPEPWSQRFAKREFEVYAIEPTVEVQAADRAIGAAIDRLVALAAEHSFELAAVLIPDRIQLEHDDWEEAMRGYGLDPAAADPRAPAALFSRLLGERGVPTLDLAPAFEAAIGDGAELYYPLDRHWTVAGHELAAEALASFLLAEGLVGHAELESQGDPPPQPLP